jgi:hypothetical protein
MDMEIAVTVKPIQQSKGKEENKKQTDKPG